MEKASHLRDMSDEQLNLTLKDATKTLFKLLIQAQTERLDAPSELKKHRRFIARIKTVQRERELQAAQQAEKAVETLT
jgi:large subunit ribosomal protein L29